MGRLRSEQRDRITKEDRKRAVDLIEQIRQENGNCHTLIEELDLDPESHRKLERVLSSLEQKANNSITVYITLFKKITAN